jgi:hypothetical protein
LIHRAGDVATLAIQLRQVSQDPTLGVRLREGAIARRSEMTWSAAAKELAGVYVGRLSA